MNPLQPQDIEKRILIALDHSENARRAVAHLGGMVCALGEFQITLMNVVMVPEEDYFTSPDDKQDWLRDEEDKVSLLMDSARSFLVSAGYDPANIRTLVKKDPTPSISHSIIKEAAKGYGIVALGRQGMTPKEEFLLGSVSKEVLSQVHDCAVWIIT